MRPKMGTFVPETGTFVPLPNQGRGEGRAYAASVAVALRQHLGGSRRATKTVMQWTGASERTVKHWFAGTRAPSGEHLVTLARYSQHVWDVLVSLSGRKQVSEAEKLAAARVMVSELHELIDNMGQSG